jgi:hypothetical protein
MDLRIGWIVAIVVLFAACQNKEADAPDSVLRPAPEPSTAQAQPAPEPTPAAEPEPPAEPAAIARDPHPASKSATAKPKPDSPKQASTAKPRPNTARRDPPPAASPEPEPRAPEPQPEPEPAPVAPEPIAKPATKVTIPNTSRVRVEVPPGLQAWLDKDTRMQPWLGKVIKVIDACYGDVLSSNASAAGTITFKITMHENARPDPDIQSLPGQLSGVVACATGQLMRTKMPLFTGREGETYVVRVKFGG